MGVLENACADAIQDRAPPVQEASDLDASATHISPSTDDFDYDFGEHSDMQSWRVSKSSGETSFASQYHSNRQSTESRGDMEVKHVGSTDSSNSKWESRDSARSAGWQESSDLDSLSLDGDVKDSARSSPVQPGASSAPRVTVGTSSETVAVQGCERYDDLTHGSVVFKNVRDNNVCVSKGDTVPPREVKARGGVSARFESTALPQSDKVTPSGAENREIHLKRAAPRKEVKNVLLQSPLESMLLSSCDEPSGNDDKAEPLPLPVDGSLSLSE